jgi:hypothetical protein
MRRVLSEGLVGLTFFGWVQFGHNDPKEDKHISIKDFQRNLKVLAKEVKSVSYVCAPIS